METTTGLCKGCDTMKDVNAYGYCRECRVDDRSAIVYPVQSTLGQYAIEIHNPDGGVADSLVFSERTTIGKFLKRNGV